MQKDYHCSYSILGTDVICEYKCAHPQLPPSITLHNHDGYEIVLFLSGEHVTIYVESERKELVRGDLILINSYTFHGLSLIDSSNYERVVINIEERYLKKISTENTDLSCCFHQSSPNALNLIHLNESEISHFMAISSNLERAMKEEHYGHDILKRALLSELLIYINMIRPASAPPSYSNTIPEIVSNTFTYIEKNLTTNITVEKMARSLHHNSDYLSRCFREATGYTLKHYVLAKRIALAQKYLREGSSPYDVCFFIGFNNYSSFSRAFSKQIGCSPKQYQLMYRKKIRAEVCMNRQW
ncbi:MAG: helix-turn-helix domain-containing protein [Lachnospiraceae bacterium]|nr:helix-turn-helix domain-containing protein [Lachnospiraceae bacterium]